MTLLAIYSSPTTPGGPGWGEDVSGAIRLGSITGLAGEAEMGAVGEGNIVLDDPLGTVGHASDGIVGLKQFSFRETACPVGNQRLYTSYVADRRYHRGQNDSLITTVARKIDVTLTDLNSFLSFRVFPPTAEDPTSDFDRPAETDLERVAALLTTVDFISTTLFDVGYIPTTGGVAMDANDYTGSRPIDVLNDCAQASGRNFWVKYHEATNQLVLWYDVWTTDGSATLVYDSALRLTNVESEHDGSVTFAIEPDAVAVLDPSRVVSAVYLPYDGPDSPAYQTQPTTAYTFAWRDMVAPSVSVKTAAKADALAIRYLVDNSTEEERISCTVQVPNTKVTGIHEGMRIQVHFTHIPNVQSGFTWCRILQRTIRQDKETPEFYWLDLELSPIPSLSCSTQVSAISPTDSGTIHSASGYSQAISVPSTAPAVGLALLAVVNGGTDVGSALNVSGWTLMDSFSTVAYDHIMSAVAYKTIPTNTNLVATWSGGTTNYCEVLGFSLSTSATAPVQEAGLPVPGTGSTITLGAAPTVGNVLVLQAVVAWPWMQPFTLDIASGWVRVNSPIQVVDPTSVNPPIMVTYVHCVEAGDAAAWTFYNPSFVHYYYLSEWAFLP